MRHVPHLLLPPPWGSILPLADQQRLHLAKVLRLGEGDSVTYTDGEGTRGRGWLRGGQVERGDEVAVAPPTDLTLAAPPPSARERARFLVEKAAELGVQRLLWVRTVRGEGKAPNRAKAMAWAASALEQSRGSWLMEVGEAEIAGLDPARLVVADAGGAPEPPADRSNLLVGPEGGLDPGEIPAGAARLDLGPTVLRVETAALTGIVLLRETRRRVRAH